MSRIRFVSEIRKNVINKRANKNWNKHKQINEIWNKTANVNL